MVKPIAAAACLCSIAALAAAQRAPERFDLIVRHGTVLDGSGQTPYTADVGVIGGFIAKVGSLAGTPAAAEIDATNLYVAPGFVNIHSHAAPAALARAENMLTQGVTTEILNPDGGGAIDIARQLADDGQAGLALNIGAYIGFNSVWTKVVGEADRRPTPGEIAEMQRLVLDGLQHGAWGVSAGLDYKPAYFAQTSEVVEVVQPAGKWRTIFTNHDRLTPETTFSSRAGIAETIEIGEKAGLIPVITHMKAQGVEQGTAPALLALMRQATARGHYTAADVYPYLAGQTSLGALIIPAWAQDGGREKMFERFKDPQLRAKIVIEAEQALKARFGGPEGVYLPATKRELTDVMKTLNVSAGEAVVRLLAEDNHAAILRFGSEADLIAILQYPAASVACDCGATTETRTHPRMYGTFPRVLGHYVRETHALTWQDAVRKMTSLPAATIGMIDRGAIQPGMAADLTVFDPATVRDRATYEDPAQLSDGIRFVIVNGAVALRDGTVTGEHGGRVLLRGPDTPSRPTSAGSPQQLSATTSQDGNAFTVRVTQNAGARHATGTFSVTDRRDSITYDATELGAIQSDGTWSSLTGRLRARATGAEHAFVFTIDRPQGAVPVITLSLDGHRLADNR